VLAGADHGDRRDHEDRQVVDGVAHQTSKLTSACVAEGSCAQALPRKRSVADEFVSFVAAER
jgi:hypothetical protein